MINRQFLWLTGTALMLLPSSIVMRPTSDCLAHPPITGCPDLGRVITNYGGGLYPNPARAHVWRETRSSRLLPLR